MVSELQASASAERQAASRMQAEARRTKAEAELVQQEAEQLQVGDGNFGGRQPLQSISDWTWLLWVLKSYLWCFQGSYSSRMFLCTMCG